ncbi:hypothetical protein RJ639_007369 [Escallonia herrerae]|uniref:Reverse transcriptase Ty1/copia-type domain-containing protein n=1 Tax=Escallonia herrerae TaxID=1293975 RepID=A0AA88VVR4_9ASTE|nr:hypothetical protein RJ639_007369 [Escallonia herrerae]
MFGTSFNGSSLVSSQGGACYFVSFIDDYSRKYEERSKLDTKSRKCTFLGYETGVKALVDGSYIFLTLYVDDLLIAAKSKSEIAQLKALLSAEFKMKDLGAAKKILEDLDSRRSMTGYVITFCGGPICWRSVLQSTSSLSATEAEYMTVTEASKKALWLKGLVEELDFKQGGILLHCDSQSAIHLAKNQGMGMDIVTDVKDSVDVLVMRKNLELSMTYRDLLGATFPTPGEYGITAFLSRNGDAHQADCKVTPCFLFKHSMACRVL